MMSALYKADTLCWIFIVLADWNNSLLIDIFSILTHHPHLEPISFCSFSLMLQVQRSSNYHFHNLGLNGPWFKTTIYHTGNICLAIFWVWNKNYLTKSTTARPYFQTVLICQSDKSCNDICNFKLLQIATFCAKITIWHKL
jgi:hypothetical protein